MQYLGMVVKAGDLRGQARGFSTLAGLYEETKQLAKAQEYYKNVSENKSVCICMPTISSTAGASNTNVISPSSWWMCFIRWETPMPN